MAVEMAGLPNRVRLTALPPLALYVHVPWCVRKCPYCDFNSHEVRGALPEAEYAQALIADLEQALPLVWGRGITSIFFGGGTPSLLAPATIDSLLSAIRARLPVAADAEITLEANPGTLEAGKFPAFRAAGINRLSLGIQSLDAGHLRALGRIHDAREAHAALDLAGRWFDNFNVDLMYGLPEQGVHEAERDIHAVLQYAPPHLSVYHLTLEPNTLFHKCPPRLPDDDTAAAMQEQAEALLAGRGYVHYETSAFAQPGRMSRHNLNYWTFGDYLGIGAGAHGKISFPDRIVRQVRYRQPREYLQRAPGGTAVQQERVVTPGELGFEFMMNALRLNEGFAARLFPERAGLPLHVVARELAAADHQHIRPTMLGRRFLNEVLQIFLPDEADAGRQGVQLPGAIP